MTGWSIEPTASLTLRTVPHLPEQHAKAHGGVLDGQGAQGVGVQDEGLDQEAGAVPQEEVL